MAVGVELALALVLVLVLGVLALCVWVWRENMRFRRDAQFLEEVLNLTHQGLVVFDQYGVLKLYNTTAGDYFPFLRQNQTAQLSKFFDYLYDHAVEDDGKIERLKGAMIDTSHYEGFVEVVHTSEGLCLVRSLMSMEGNIVFSLKDISAYERQGDSFQRLSEYSSDLVNAIEAATNGIVIIDYSRPGAPVLFANNAFCDIAYDELGDVVGQSFVQILHKTFDDESALGVLEVLMQKKQADIDIQTHAEEGRQFYNLKITPMVNLSHRRHLFVAIFTDTTELKQREAISFKGQKLEALGQLAAGVAHDFNNVLSIIDGYTHMALKATSEEEENLNDFLGRIKAASARGAALTDKMLTFGRAQVAVNEVVDIAEMVKEQDVLLKPLLGAAIDLRLDIEAGSFFMECVPDNFTQILMNLVVNASHAMPDGGEVTIGLAYCHFADLPEVISRSKNAYDSKQKFAVLSVEDCGTGIDPEIRDKIFDPFFTTKPQGKGTGLGLSVVYGLVRQMRGEMTLDSELGAGTTFKIFLPLSRKTKMKVISGGLDDVKAASLQGYRALVVEDEPDLLEIVSGMLEDLGMDVLRAQNGNEALMLQEDCEGAIDLLLTDVMMPELGGIKLAELFSALRPRTKIIFMSGYAGKDQGGDRPTLPEDSYFLPKPLRYEKLAEMIIQVLSVSPSAQSQKKKA